jgi:putative transcription factor
MNKDYNKHYNALDNHQDWKTVIVSKPKTDEKSSKKKPSNTSLKNMSVEKKAEEGNLEQKKYSLELRQSIMKGRSAKSLTQKQLANSINLPLQVISDIESGKGVYNPQHINKIKRFLKIT